MESKKKDKSYSHILKYTGVFGGVQGLNILIGVVRNKLTALLLGPNGMGLVSLFNSTINMVVSASSFGIPTSGVQDISDKYAKGQEQLRDSIKVVRSWSLVTAIIGMFLCAVFSPVLNRLTFSWGDHTLHFALLSPVVALLILVGGEMAVLKATRQLKALACVSLLVVVASLLISVPIYYIWGQSGIVAVLVLQAFVQLCFTIRYSTRYYPYRVSFRFRYLQGEMHIVKLGLAFVLSGILSSGAEFLIRTYINKVDQLDEVGLFNAGCTLAITYAGLVFSAMEADYFPRLCSFKEEGSELDNCVNRQVEVNVLLVTPFLIAMLFGLPILIPLLYDASFNGMLRMTQFATVSMLFRAIYLPIEYLPLSKGESKMFLLQEAFAVILLVSLEIVGYRWNGLTGLGIGIALAYLIETIVVIMYSRFYYAYCLSCRTLRFMLIQLAFVLVSLCVVLSGVDGVCYWGVAVVCTLVNAGVNLYFVQRETDVFDLLRAKLRR